MLMALSSLASSLLPAIGGASKAAGALGGLSGMFGSSGTKLSKSSAVSNLTTGDFSGNNTQSSNLMMIAVLIVSIVYIFTRKK